jgi:long-chain acyl-CoA synthetase
VSAWNGDRPDPVINRIVAGPPERGHRFTIVRLGHTETVDLADLYGQSGRVAAYLWTLGVSAGDRIGILAANGLEWVLLDLAALRLGAVTAGFPVDQFTPDAALLARYDLAVLYTDRPCEAPGIRAMSEVRDAVGLRAVAPQPVTYAPGDTTTLKFTSGSTGVPKGLAATVGSIDASLTAVQQLFAHGAGDDLFIFLPLSLLQQRYWIYSALAYGHDVTVTTYEAAFAALRTVHPTVVMGVPAFFDTARRHIEAAANGAGVGAAVVNGAHDADVSAAARRFFGGRVRYLWTGSAPANPATLRFFNDAGLPIYEGYGLNETCIVSKNAPGASREGSVGRILPGKHVTFDETGVISVRSDHPVNTRYTYAAPGESERVVGPDGTVRTGDVGHLDADGFLYIYGRADDIVALPNGRNLAVRPIEEHMKSHPAIEECVVYFRTRRQLVAIVSPAADPPDRDAITAQLRATNAGLGPDEQIRRVVIAQPRFSIGNGMLTAQFKPQRRRIAEAYRTELDDDQRGIHAN